MKGWGKDPVAAVLCLVELLGPVVFSHFEDGQPVGKRNPKAWVQIAAVNESQTKNTMLLIPDLLPKRTIEHFNLDVQKQIIQVKGKPTNRIEVLSASYRGQEGNRPTFIIMNETHHWVPNRNGDQLYETLRLNARKVRGRFLCITNAYVPGEASVAEEIRMAVDREREGRAADSGWLYDSIEAHPDAPLSPDWAPFIAEMISGDSHWLPIEDIVEDIIDTSIPPSKTRRMWYNQIVASEDAVFSEGEWDAIELEEALKWGDDVVLGFDGGRTDDATALVAMRISDGALEPVAIWESPATKSRKDNVEKWEVSTDEVDSMVHFAFRKFRVHAFYADVAGWEPYIKDWGDTYRDQLRVKASTKYIAGYDMRGTLEKTTRTNEAFIQAVLDGTVAHTGDVLLRRHVLNTRRRENQYGTSFGKEGRESPKKIDAYAASLLCYMALLDLGERGKELPPEYSQRLIQI